jgi:hypothetical protein
LPRAALRGGRGSPWGYRILNVVELLAELRDLLADPQSNWGRIGTVLAEHRGLAEHQAARFLVARASVHGGLAAEAQRRLASVDPRVRLQGIEVVLDAFPRSLAGKLLRRVVKDPDATVGRRARAAVRKLGLNDVALPDARYDGPHLGGWHPAGWCFGLFRFHTSNERRPPRPTRVAALGAVGLPALRSVADLVALLELDGEDALARLMRPGTDVGSAYVEFEVPKATGGTRRLAAPRGPLRRVQRMILDRILARVPVHDACHGFVPGRSTVTNARPHQRAALVLKTDLRDFFPSVHYRRVWGLFAQLGYNQHPVAALLAGLTCYRPRLPDGRVVWPGVLPQGAPTSPALANLACRRLDVRLARLASRMGGVYTRYADDLTFSFADQPELNVGRFWWWIDQICQQEGFHEHAGKRRVLRPNGQQRVTGVVVNDGLHVPRRERRRFRALLHDVGRVGLEAAARGREDLGAYLAGYAAYVRMVEPALGARWGAEVARLLGESRA